MRGSPGSTAPGSGRLRARLRRRVRAYASYSRWLLTTPWPVLVLDMVGSNIVGALFVFGFLRFVLPIDEGLRPADIVSVDQLGFVAYLGASMVVGAIAIGWLVYPILQWQRGNPGVDVELAKRRALQLPRQITTVLVALWIVGGAIFVVVNAHQSTQFALVNGCATVLGMVTTCSLQYMQSERFLRPITVAALADDPTTIKGLSVSGRIVLTWVVGTLVPIFGILTVVLGEQTNILGQNQSDLMLPIALLCGVALLASLVGTIRLANAVSDPIRALFQAQREVQQGNFDTRIPIYDSSELGFLQAGFNDMAHDLAERERLRDMFGRYVGEDVARRALEVGTSLGGGERDVAVLFVDLVGSTTMAASQPPQEVVSLLNEFFKIVVDAVDEHGGFVNKFQGDAALAIFGAPIAMENHSRGALRAARDMHGRLEKLLGPHGFGIGVSSGRAIAGHIGAAARFEYTVIGDPVNEAARITELAKDTPELLLASAQTVTAAGPEEANHWALGEVVSLRGRLTQTTLAYPAGRS